MGRQLAERIFLAGAIVLGTTLAAHGQIQYTGLEHSSLGGAVLGLTPDGQLQVSNIGSSGEDGVAIDLGELQGVGLNVTNAGRDRLLVQPVSQALGRLGGLEVRNVGNTLELYGVVPQTAGTYEFELTVIDDSGLTSFPVNVGGGLLGTLNYDAGEIPELASIGSLIGTNPQTGKKTQSLVFSEPVRFSGASGVSRRTAVVTMTPAAGTSFDADHFNTLEVTSSVPSVPPTGAQAYPDEMHTVLGFSVEITGAATATYTDKGRKLTVGNIGSSGEDGVTIHARSINDADLANDSLVATLDTAAETSGMATGKRQHAPIRVTKQVDKSAPKLLQAAVKGKVFNQVEILYTTTIDNTGSNWVQLSTDFSPLGGSAYLVDVFQEGVLVASGGGFASSLVELEGLPPGEPLDDTYVVQYNESDWDFISRSHASVRLPGMITPAPLDETKPVKVSFRAFEAENLPEFLTSVDFRYTGAGDVTITHISQVPEPASLVLLLMAVVGLRLVVRK